MNKFECQHGVDNWTRCKKCESEQAHCYIKQGEKTGLENEIESLRQQLAEVQPSALKEKLRCADDRISELERQLAEARAGRVSEGYTIVPVEPTQSILNAMNVALTTGRLSAYRAMLEAAKRCEYCDDTGDLHTPTGEWRGVCICAAGKQQPPAGGVVPSDADILSLAYDCNAMPEQMTDKALIRFARALLAQPQPQASIEHLPRALSNGQAPLNPEAVNRISDSLNAFAASRSSEAMQQQARDDAAAAERALGVRYCAQPQQQEDHK